MLSTTDREAAISADGTLRHPRAASPSGPTIVRLCGALDIDGAPALRERLIGVLHRGAGLLVLDLSQVLSCDASGLAVLMGTQRRARLLGIMMRLAAPSLPVTRVLRSTGLDRSFTIFPDLCGALRSEPDEPAGPAPARPVPSVAGQRGSAVPALAAG
jgi:anti-sigma B factor antagonist